MTVLRTVLVTPFLAMCVRGFIPANNPPPVAYAYTAVARASFDSSGRQVGLRDEEVGGSVTGAPSRFPRTRDRIVSESAVYVIEGVLGEGTGSSVYRAVDGRGAAVAIKFQAYADAERAFSVETEFEVMKKAYSQFPSLFPRPIELSGLGSVRTPDGVVNLRYLVMELLGSSVWALLRSRGHKLGIRTVASIGIQTVEILEKLHSIGMIHGDIHVENILFRAGNPDADGNVFSDRIVLGDYGRSTSFKDPKTGVHKSDVVVPLRPGRNLMYLSPFELALESPSRREDIFRLIESLARMVDQRRYAEVLRPFVAGGAQALLNAKRTVRLADVMLGLHPGIAEMYSYARSMAFEDTPNYALMKHQFLQMIQQSGTTYNGKILL